MKVNQDQQQRLLDNSRRCMINAQSEWAKKYWELQQENNLLYVQVTRAKHHLTKVNVPTIDKK